MTFESLKVGDSFKSWGRDFSGKKNGNCYTWEKVSAHFCKLIAFTSTNEHAHRYFQSHIGRRIKGSDSKVKIDEVI